MDGPLRILHAVVNMNRGGAETLLMNLYRNINRSSIQFDFLTCKEGVFDEEIKQLGGRIYRIPYISEVGHSGYQRELHQFFQTAKDYSIIHAHMDRMSGFVLRAAHKANIPIRIAHSHNTQSEGGIAAKAYKWYAGKHISTSATHLFACSHAAARWLFADKANTACLLKNGIDGDRFAYDEAIRTKLRAELGISDRTLAIGHVGRFAQQKNHALLIQIFKELQQARPYSMLLLAGDGPLRPDIERQVQSCGLSDKVKFLGIREDIEHLLQSFDVFVFPSLHEGLPVTLIEAQGAGLACVISDHITSEADLGLGLIDFVSNDSIDAYVDRIIDAGAPRSRVLAPDVLVQQGYEIKQTARWLEQFYTLQFEVTHEYINRVHTHV